LWKDHPKNILNSKYIATYRINWEDKVSNIKSIVEELNIGLDSVIFIDDNPVERELVKNFLPEITAPDFPSHPYSLVDFFWEIYNEHFITYGLSKEDLKKTDQYKENSVRTRERKLFLNLDDYLTSLDMEISISKASDSNISRISQMTQKTNQFNLTTKRYTEENIRDYVNKGAFVFCCDLKDKFGDNGITIAGIFIPISSTEIEIDSYLLSCRILGRDIEIVTIQYMLNYFQQKGFVSFRARFIPTSKNILAAEFLDRVGFSLIESKSGTKYYHLDLQQQFAIKQYYKISMYGGKDQRNNG
jgi:FkbH-like protein